MPNVEKKNQQKLKKEECKKVYEWKLGKAESTQYLVGQLILTKSLIQLAFSVFLHL